MQPSQMVDTQLMKILAEEGPAAAVSAFVRPVLPMLSQKVRGQPLPSLGAHDKKAMLHSFPLLSEEFCRLLMEELKHAVGLQAAGSKNFSRPNTMNNYGFVVEELGLDLWPLVREVLAPLAALVFPQWGGASLDTVHAFTISYSMNGDRDLSRHMDQSEVTVNVNLGGDFNGGEVYFNGQRDSPMENKENTTVIHHPGVALLHVGQHWHGARRLASGERHNLVLWLRSRAFKSSPAQQFCSRCRASVSGFHSRQQTGTPARLRAPKEGLARGHGELR